MALLLREVNHRNKCKNVLQGVTKTLHSKRNSIKMLFSTHSLQVQALIAEKKLTINVTP